MSGLRRWGPMAALVVLLAPGMARAQRFAPVLITSTYNPTGVSTPSGVSGPEEEAGRLDRLQVGAYLAMWDLFKPKAPTGIQEVKFNAKSSALLTADYFLTRNVSIGGWYNSLEEEVEVTPVGGQPFRQQAGTANFWDAHVTYYPKKIQGLSVQLGYSEVAFKQVDLLSNTRIRPSFKPHSWNVWANYSRPVGRYKGRPIAVFGSVGKYTGDKGKFFNAAWNAILGGSIGITRNLDLATSWWLFDFDKSSTRWTLGLNGHF